MSIEVRWASPAQEAIIASLPPRWEVEDFERARHAIIRLGRSVDHPVVVILDGTGTRLPANFIAYATTLTRKGPRLLQNAILYVLVTPDRLIQSMYSAFIRVQGAGLFTNRLQLVSTLEEALTLTRSTLKEAS
ncbi:MAG: hypothetical protein JXN59_17855 [Anaerolineae bacterium]|nr:hypothetical protein [Anaerolineae bacterium]